MISDPIRIILVDDHRLARESLGFLLGQDTRFTVIKQCDNGHDAIEQARQLSPDIILLDINMSPINGFEVAQSVLETNPAQKIIGISVNNQPAYVDRMLAIGARGFVSKGMSFAEITNAIMEVFEGRKYVSSDIRGELPGR